MSCFPMFTCWKLQPILQPNLTLTDQMEFKLYILPLRDILKPSLSDAFCLLILVNAFMRVI